MNAAHIHLAVNHVPIVLAGAGLLFLVLSGLGARRNLAQGGQLLLVLAVLGVVPTYLSGEPAEEVIEHMTGVSEETIEAHEDRALPAAILTAATGLLAIGGLMAERGGRALSRTLVRWSAFAALLSFSSLLWLGLAGGRIRHPEVAGAQEAPATRSAPSPPAHP